MYATRFEDHRSAVASQHSDQTSSSYKRGDLIAGRYRLEQPLGEGGMGVVWSATNLQLDAPVAIKLLQQSSPEQRELLTERLKQEAKAAAQLGHPAAVRIFDAGETELGDPFIVMERLNGRSLAEWIDQTGALPVVLAVQILLPIAEALCAAHAKGIIHRDVKPDNVFIDENESDQGISPKLVDFGLVKVVGPTDGATYQTQTGIVLGSPAYMSPEQARGEQDIDERTDIWSFCVLLYEAITGQTPFEAANSKALLISIAMDEPWPVAARSAEELDLWNIMRRGLEKNRALRFHSMLELGSALATWLIRHGVHEDACGASLESRWVLRSAEAPVAGCAPSPVVAVETGVLGSGGARRALTQAFPTSMRALQSAKA